MMVKASRLHLTNVAKVFLWAIAISHLCAGGIILLSAIAIFTFSNWDGYICGALGILTTTNSIGLFWRGRIFAITQGCAAALITAFLFYAQGWTMGVRVFFLTILLTSVLAYWLMLQSTRTTNSTVENNHI
jgi:hypothetical protein